MSVIPVIPANAGIQDSRIGGDKRRCWTPASAGVTDAMAVGGGSRAVMPVKDGIQSGGIGIDKRCCWAAAFAGVTEVMGIGGSRAVIPVKTGIQGFLSTQQAAKLLQETQ